MEKVGRLTVFSKELMYTIRYVFTCSLESQSIVLIRMGIR